MIAKEEYITAIENVEVQNLMVRSCVLLLLCFALCCFAKKNVIENVHIAKGGNSTSVAISWLTSQPTFTSVVYYGTTLPLTNSMNATSNDQSSYSDKSGWNHNVVLENLTAGTLYYYVCGDPTWAISEQFSFRTEKNDFVSTTIAAYGDLGIDNSADTINQLINRTASGDFGLYVHMGDISYANDHPLHYERTWNTWFASMEPIMATVPYMVAPGNHESWCRNPICAVDTFNFTTYKEKFRMPGNESGSGTNMFYSFDYYNIHFVAISTESDYPGAPILDPSPEQEQSETYYLQENWLHDDLTKAVANRENVPWIILFGHRPIYAPDEQTGGVPDGYAAHVQNFFEPILNQYEVDIFLTGHVHAYARTYPTYKNVVTGTSFDSPSSTVHVCAGGAGNREGFSTFPSTKPSWYAGGNDSAYGYGTFTANTLNSLTWDYYLSNTGEKYDSFTITK